MKVTEYFVGLCSVSVDHHNMAHKQQVPQLKFLSIEGNDRKKHVADMAQTATSVLSSNTTTNTFYTRARGSVQRRPHLNSDHEDFHSIQL